MKSRFAARLLFVTLPFVISAAITAPAQVTRDNLSDAARQFLPDRNMVDITLRDGRSVRAELIRQTETGYDLRVTTGTITARRTVARDDVDNVRPVPVAEYFAAGLRNFEIDPVRNLPPARYRQALSLFDEYMELFPDSDDAAWIAEQRDLFREEYRNIEQGLQKIGSEWLTPVQAAVLQFDHVTRAMSDLTNRYPNIVRAEWRDDAAARQQYDTLRDNRREIARRVPRLLNERIPVLIEGNRFEEAFLEMNVCLRFWIARVMEAEATATDRLRFGRGVFEGMDFDYLLRLQRRIMTAYMAAYETPSVPDPESLPDDMVYIPGGYFFMGNEQASPDDDSFPFRVVFVNPFLIDRAEVSNAEYREFVDHVRQSGDYSMSHPSAPPLKDHSAEGWKHPALSGDRQPVVGVDWFDAYAYLNWRGKRLPTEAERELASRGRDGQTYPWGETAPGSFIVNSPTGRRHVAALMDEQVPPRPPPRQSSGFSCRRKPPPPAPQPTELPAVTWSVDQWLPEEALDGMYVWEDIDPLTMNPFGLFHMAGNAAEWVADWYHERYYNRIDWDNPQGPGTGTERVFRGGSYLCDDTELAASRRNRPVNELMKRGLSKEGKPMIGFRGVRDLPLAGGGNAR